METQEVAIIKQENIQTIISVAPQSYRDNKLSREKCEAAGQEILDVIMQSGMTDELDQRAALYIEKARKTVKKMNERRSPVTKLFDEIRKEFTAMESAIDPAKSNTIPYILQQHRNQFAAKKRIEEEERRRKEYERQQLEAARIKMRQDVELDLQQQFQRLVTEKCNILVAIDNAITLDNYEDATKKIEAISATLPADFIDNLHAVVWIPPTITQDELRSVETETKQRLSKQFIEQYAYEIGTTKQNILDRLPSKKTNLERIAQANAEEAARIKAEMEQRQQAEAAEQEAARKRKEEEEKQKAEMARKQAEMTNLFGQQSLSQQTYQPKVKVAQKINLLNPEGIMSILSMWWSKEGCHLSVEELTKMFKKQITFCEKLAKEGTYIEDESVEYVEDIKAR